MTRNLVTIRTYPGGNPATGVPYEIRSHNTGTPLLPGASSGSTDANGQFAYQANLSPGPFFWKATDNGPTPPVVRQESTRSCDSGGGFSLAEIPVALRMMGTAGVVRGFLNELAITAGSGINFNVATGAAAILGLPAVVWSAITNLTCIQPRDATNPKACYVILQARGVGDALEGEITCFDVCGAAAASPVLPTLIQNEVQWQEPLASFRLPPTGGGSVLTNVINVQRFLATKNPQVATVARRTDPAVVQPVTSTTGVDVVWTEGAPNPVLLSGILYDVVATVSLAVKAPAGSTIALAPFIGVGNIGTFLFTTTSADYVTISNTHVTQVTGTGAALSCGATIKVGSGTGNYIVGTYLLTATPRR